MSTQTVVINQPVSLTVFLRGTASGTGEAGLIFSDVTADYKLASDSTFTSKTLTSGNFHEISSGFYYIDFLGLANATASIGSGGNGVVTIVAAEAARGAAGNAYTVSVVVPAGTSGLSVALVGSVITVNLAVSGGVVVGASNTATLVAAAIDALANFTATASGTGATQFSIAEGPTAFTGGSDGDFNETGNVIVRVSGSGVDLTVASVLVIAEPSTVPTPNTPPNTTSIFGFLYDTDSSPLSGATISARLISVPIVQYTSAQSFAIASKPIVTTTDSTGFFTMDLITGATFDVFISDASYRRVLVVPTTSTNLFDAA